MSFYVSFYLVIVNIIEFHSQVPYVMYSGLITIVIMITTFLAMLSCMKQPTRQSSTTLYLVCFVGLTTTRTLSYLWQGSFFVSMHHLLNDFLKCMGKFLTMIITDQNAAMRLATLCKMPHTFHRFCKWYITHKMGDKVGRVYQDHEALNEFYEILNNYENINMFKES